MAEMDEGLARKYQRLNLLLAAANVDAPQIQTEIADLRRDINGSGHSDVDIDARTNPRRFEPDFTPTGK